MEVGKMLDHSSESTTKNTGYEEGSFCKGRCKGREKIGNMWKVVVDKR
jgi:hypothetical protein